MLSLCLPSDSMSFNVNHSETFPERRRRPKPREHPPKQLIHTRNRTPSCTYFQLNIGLVHLLPSLSVLNATFRLGVDHIFTKAPLQRDSNHRPYRTPTPNHNSDWYSPFYGPGFAVSWCTERQPIRCGRQTRATSTVEHKRYERILKTIQ